MRVVVAHNFYQQAGGEDQVFSNEVNLLRGRGHEVFEYSVHNDEISRMNSVELGIKAIWNRDSYRTLLKLFRQKRPDIVHVHNTSPLISPAIYHAANAAGAAVVQSLHNFRFSCPSATFFRDGRVCESCLGRSFAWPGVFHRCYRNSRSATVVSTASSAFHRSIGTYSSKIHRYIAFTEFGAAKFAKMGIPSSRISIKPNFLPEPPSAGTGRGEYALFAGRLSPEKGIDVLLKASRELPEIPLKIVGSGPEDAKVIAASRSFPHIDALGAQTHQQVISLMQEASFLIFPSQWYEGFPMTIVEAFATGLPVIASKLGAMSTLIDHGRTGLHFAPGDAQDLVQKMSWAIQNIRQMESMRHQVRQHFFANFTAARNYEILSRIYEEALSERNGSHEGVRAPTVELNFKQNDRRMGFERRKE